MGGGKGGCTASQLCLGVLAWLLVPAATLNMGMSVVVVGCLSAGAFTEMDVDLFLTACPF